MSLHDDMERCDHCMARFRAGGCDRWGTEVPPCEQSDYDEDDCEAEEDDEDADS